MMTSHILYDKNAATFMLQLFYDKNSRQTLANHVTCKTIPSQ